MTCEIHKKLKRLGNLPKKCQLEDECDQTKASCLIISVLKKAVEGNNTDTIEDIKQESALHSIECERRLN